MTPQVGRPVLANSIRLIMAMLRLAAGIESNFGRAILNILAEQYPEAKEEIAKEPASPIGGKMLAIARRELQNDNQAAMDAVQDVLAYLVSSKFNFKAQTKSGNPGAGTWREALRNLFSNIRTRAMSHSMKRFRKVAPEDTEQLAHLKWVREQSKKPGSKMSWTAEDEKELAGLEKALTAEGTDPETIAPKKMERKGRRDRTIDEAFGKRGEDGGAAEGGEGRVPGNSESLLGKALDDKAAVKEFMDLMDEHVPLLQQELPVDQRALFDLIFEDEVGGFSSDIQDNMGQASALKDKLLAGDDGQKAIYKKNEKRWSGFVGDLRKKLLDSIWNYIDKHMTTDEYNVLKETFFSDTTPGDVRGIEKKKIQEKIDYQRDIDLRKVLRMRSEGDTGKSYENLVRKLQKELKDEGKDLDSELKRAEPEFQKLESKKPKGKKPAPGPESQAQVSQQAASRLAERFTQPVWS